jgi:hypothetical protein
LPRATAACAGSRARVPSPSCCSRAAFPCVMERGPTGEGPFLQFQLRRARESNVQAKALVSDSSTTVGWATLAPATHWFKQHWLLDLDAHPGFRAELPRLVEALKWPEAPVMSYTSGKGVKSDLLLDLGFAPLATIPDWLTVGAEERDITVWRGRPG